jgi:hypothetical protein
VIKDLVNQVTCWVLAGFAEHSSEGSQPELLGDS